MGLEDLKKLRDELSKVKDPGKQRNMLRTFLYEVKEKNHEAHIGRYTDLIDAVEAKFNRPGAKFHSAAKLVEGLPIIETFTAEIVDKNIKIISKYRNPGAVILAGTAALVTGAFSYRNTQRELQVSETAELSYIDRIEKERMRGREPAGTPTATH